MRTEQYARLDTKIRAADGDGIIVRWRYGGRLLMDPTAMTESGKSLRHGVTERLIEAARRKGIELSAREIRWRIQCARVYRTDAQIGNAVTDFGAWRDLIAAGFPPYEDDEDGPPADFRTDEEKRHDAAAKLTEAVGEQGVLFHVEMDPDETTVKDLIVYADEQHEITQRFVDVDERRREYVERLTAAVDGDESCSWREAHRAAYGTDDVDDRKLPGTHRE